MQLDPAAIEANDTEERDKSAFALFDDEN